MSTKPNIPEEEVDLGTLFNQIGKMFSNFFNFVGNIFKAIYHYFIILLLFLRKHILILGLATLIGAVVGFLLDLNKEKVFESKMSVEVAYGSGSRLYNQIDYLNNLIFYEDSISLGKIFDIPSKEAASLLFFEAKPIDPEKNRYLDFDDYIQNTDTIYTYSREFTYDDFIKRKEDSDIKFQKIIAEAYRPRVFEKLNFGIKKLVENDYYKDLKAKKLEELTFEKEKLKENISQVDSLRKRYKETAYLQFEEKMEENSGVSFRTINAGYKGNVDKDLYYLSDTLLLKLRDVNELLVANDDILKIQSGFTVGEVKKSISSKGWVRFGFLGFALVFLVLVGLQFNKYLNRYEKTVSS